MCARAFLPMFAPQLSPKCKHTHSRDFPVSISFERLTTDSWNVDVLAVRQIEQFLLKS